MNIVTVMNYDMGKKNYLAMCCNWIRHARRNLSRNDSCFIFSKNKPHPLLKSFVGGDPRFRFCVREGFRDSSDIFFPLCGSHSEGENFTYKLHIACGLDFPFIFIDADTLILESIKDLEPLFSDMPVIFVDHESDIKGHTDIFPPFINSGVFMVNDPSKSIMNWDNMLLHARKCGFHCIFKNNGKQISGTDQSVIKSYLDSLGYNYKHKKFGINYNTCAEGVKIFKAASGWVAENSKGDRVKIVHYWGPFKPWSVGCPIFKEFLDDEVFRSDDVLDETGKCQQNN